MRKLRLRLFGSRKELKATLPANKVNDKSATVFIRPEHARLQAAHHGLQQLPGH